jgi:hypothetical protein
MKLSSKQFGGIAVVVVAIIASVAVVLREAPSEQSSQDTTVARKPTPRLGLNYSLPVLPPAPQIDQSIRPGISKAININTPTEQRIELIDQLGADLTETEVLVLLHEILNGPPSREDAPWHSTYIHKVCGILQGVPSSHDALANVLSSVAADRAFPEVHRDYAFQHLRILWHASLDPSAPTETQLRNASIEATFRKLAVDRPETAAQSLLGLHELRHTRDLPAVDDSEIAELVRTTLSSPADPGNLAARMTAIRILGERRIQDQGETLRGIASSSTEHSLVRASAIAALGHIALPDDLNFLRSINSRDPIVTEALKHATRSF